MQKRDINEMGEELAQEIRRKLTNCGEFDFGVWIEVEGGKKERVRIRVSFLGQKLEEQS